MERYLNNMIRFAVIALLLGGFAFYGCSSDDPADPGKPDPQDPVDTTTIDQRKRPVVFVHGAMEAVDVFTHMTQLFMINGYTDEQIDVQDFELFMDENGDVDVDKMATAVKARVDALTTITNEDRVDIIAHGAGAKAVQKYLATLEGTKKIAHVVYAGPEYDLNITVNGTHTPAPCKYLTLRSNGKDALQNGDVAYGSLNGARNEILADHDNRQLVSSTQAFATIYAFFTGGAPVKQQLLISKAGLPYILRGRVINFIDNTGIGGASIVSLKIRKTQQGDYQRLVGGPSIVTDAEGYFELEDVLTPDSHIELLVRTPTATHYDMHIYRLPWRENSKTERLRMIPRAGGSMLLTKFSAAMRTGTHANAIVYTANQVLYNGRDNVLVKRYSSSGGSIGNLEVLTAGNAPLPGASGTGKNTFFLCLLDYDMNGEDGSGPVPTPALNMFGLNSFDIMLDATVTNYKTIYVMNNIELATFNYRSNGASGSNNSGFNLIQFDSVP